MGTLKYSYFGEGVMTSTQHSACYASKTAKIEPGLKPGLKVRPADRSGVPGSYSTQPKIWDAEVRMVVPNQAF
eukprot:165679-Chlamydomonas_euryale.AAC.2